MRTTITAGQTRHRRRAVTRLLAALAFVVGAGQGAALAQTGCGGGYVVQPGDTLFRIARQVYGDGSLSNFVHDANRATIGPDAGQISVGMELVMPCPDTAEAERPRAAIVTLDRPVETAAAVPPPPAATPARPPEGPVRIAALVGNPFPSGEEGDPGLIGALVAAALAEAAPDRRVTVEWLDDSGTDAAGIVLRGDHDISLPAIRPDCTQTSATDFVAQRHCSGLLWTDPIYEQVLTVYMRAEDPAPLSAADLAEQRLCRIARTPRFVLVDRGFVASGTPVREAADALACLTALDLGEADVAILPVDAASAALQSGKVPPNLVRHERLDARIALHAVLPADRNGATATRDAINTGLARIKQNGRWFDIVRQRINAYVRGD